jgi:hypothetical protein
MGNNIAFEIGDQPSTTVGVIACEGEPDILAKLNELDAIIEETVNKIQV